MNSFAFSSLFLMAAFGLFLRDAADGHGLMTSPKPRNLHAFESGLLGSFYEATAMNNNIYQTAFRSNSVCGQLQNGGPNGMDFDDYSSGIQATYQAGQVITVDVDITVYHYGHFEFSICPAGSSGTPSQDCLRQNKLRILKDNNYGAPIDPNYPERAMMPPKSFGTKYSYEVALPADLSDGDYVLKWMYVSANSCFPAGYDRYPFPTSWGPMYTNGLATCGTYDLPTPLAAPEIFINCAEIAISGGGSGPVASPSSVPAPISPAPVASQPTPQVGSYYCGGGTVGNSICEDGTCCSQYGYCGCSDDHCTGGQQCGLTAEYCGGGNVGNGICEDGSCCSEWGYCDCSEEHCINGQTCGGGTLPTRVPTKSPVTPMTPAPVRPAPTAAPVAPTRAPTTPAPVPKPTNAPVPPQTPTNGDACCADGIDGLKAANNCGGYVHCAGGIGYGYQPCSGGLKFQQNGGYCDYASNVQCMEWCSSPEA